MLQVLRPDWLFDGVPEDLVRKVSRHSEFHQRGHYLFREDELADAFYYLKHGTVDLLREDTLLVSRHAGWVIGEQAFIENKNTPHSISAKVTSSTAEVCRIDQSVAAELLAHPRFLLNLLKMVSLKLSQTTYENCVRYRNEELLFREFRSHVSPAIASELLKHGVDYGQPRFVSGVVLFSDIRDFTTASGGMDPEAVARDLGSYLDRMVELVHQHGGLVDKFIGDAVMAIWGYQSQSGHAPAAADIAAQALACAIEMVRAAGRMTFGGQTIRIGIGIEHGQLFVGSIGSGDKKQFTVLGQTANIASRYESLSKEFACNIVIGESIAALVNLELFGGPWQTRRDKEIKGAGPMTVHCLALA
jgi:class 3 adenylate cyclase